MGRKEHESYYSIQRKKRERHNGFLAVESKSVESHLQTTPKADAEQVAAFIVSLVFYYLGLGKYKFIFWLDNARTHKNKMKAHVEEYLTLFGIDQQVSIEFVHIPAYSPYLNAAEYFIHLIRHKFLTNMPPNQNIQQVLDRLIPKVEQQKLLTTPQMENIIARITQLPQKRPANFITE